ncbi:hypothetical protein KBA73_00325 [Patescibacteria group bacterium]|nr:hypothetical protein [Patescibacteria group bacterium]
MGYLTERNPTKALKTAELMSGVHKNEVFKDQICQIVGPALAVKKPYLKMDKLERTAALRALVSTSSSKEEIEQRLEMELHVSAGLYMLSVSEPATDPTGVEAVDLVRALGGLITKNSLMVMLTIMDDFMEVFAPIEDDDEGGPDDYDCSPDKPSLGASEPESLADTCYDPDLLSRYEGATSFADLFDRVVARPVMA